MTSSDTQVSESTLSAFFDLRENAEHALERLRGEGIVEARSRLTEGQGGYASGTAQGAAPAEHWGFFEALADFFFPDPDRAAWFHRRGVEP